MPRFVKKPKGEGPVPTFLCRNRAEVTAALARIRNHLGISQNELDDIAGFSQGYTGKLEMPDTPGFPGRRGSGRSAIHPMFDIWLGSLKVGLLVVPLGQEPDLEKAVPPGELSRRMTVKRAEKIRALAAAGRPKRALQQQFGIKKKMLDDILENRAFVPAIEQAKAA